MIDPKYNHGKAGHALFKICAGWTGFLIKNKWLYYLLSFTWGILMTLIGLLISLILGVVSIFNKRITLSRFCLMTRIKFGSQYWGGVSFGLTYLRDQSSVESVDKHEFGHSFQNCLFGPFFIFIVAIPSMMRWWHMKLKYTNKGLPYPQAYDAVWFEDSATQCGNYAYSIINASKESDKDPK